jgi:hypothetical protein
VPVAEPRELSDPKTISPSAAPVRVKVPVVVSAPLCAATVAEVKAAVPKLTLVVFGPVAPTFSVPTVAVFVTPSVPIVDTFTDSVPIVAVPVDAVILEPNVTAPRMVGMVAVEIVAVLAESVPIVAVPVVAEMLELKVAAPVTPRLELKVAAPVTARLDARVVAPAELSVPLELTPRVEICSAETDDSSPVAIANSVLVKGVLPDTFNN